MNLSEKQLGIGYKYEDYEMKLEQFERSDKERISYFDHLRIFACFMVIFLHVSAYGWGKTPVDTSEWKIMNFYDMMVRSAVPLFFMISGALFLNRRDINIGRIYKHNILHLLVIFIAWSMLYALGSNIKTLMLSIFNYPIHMWFIISMIAVYISIPIIFAAVHFENERYLRYIIIVFMLFGIVQPTLFLIPHDGISITKLSVQYADYCGYFVLGYYLSRADFSKVKIYQLLTVYFVSVIAAALIGSNYASYTGNASEIMMDTFILPTFAEAVSIFLIFRKTAAFNENRRTKAVTTISGCTLGIYLLHPFVISHLDSFLGISTASFSILFSVPLISVLVFILCLLPVYVMKKIPIVGKWLV